MARIGVVLSGCGVFDGSEIHEAVASLLAIARAGSSYRCMAPDREQLHVVNHFSGQVAEGESRNVLVESARIARGDIIRLSEVNVADYDGFMFPGGFGAAKNLCDFAVSGSSCNVDPAVEKFVTAAHGAGKPMCFVCIAPVIVARIFGRKGVKLTIGDDKEASAAVAEMGAEHVSCQVRELVIDDANRLITSPAYMKAGNITDLFDDVTNSVNALLEMIASANGSSASG